MDDFTPYTDIVLTLAKNIKEIKDLPCMEGKSIKYEQLSDLECDLKRSIARRPKREESDFGYYEVCPECDGVLDAYEENPYCPYCGQAIDWSDDYDDC